MLIGCQLPYLYLQRILFFIYLSKGTKGRDRDDVHRGPPHGPSYPGLVGENRGVLVQIHI